MHLFCMIGGSFQDNSAELLRQRCRAVSCVVRVNNTRRQGLYEVYHLSTSIHLSSCFQDLTLSYFRVGDLLYMVSFTPCPSSDLVNEIHKSRRAFYGINV